MRRSLTKFLVLVLLTLQITTSANIEAKLKFP